uniref:hypothetical protein n=1 Tax=Stappia sp. TaxID=1870903 RepID=UPI003BAA154D
MSLPDWPAGVPSAPQRGSFRISRPFNKPVSSEFEAGNTRDRPRGTLQYRMLAMELRMSAVEFALFDAFVSDDLARGTRRFTMPVWDGAGMVTRTVRLAGEDKFTTRQQGRAVMVGFTLEVEL